MKRTAGPWALRGYQIRAKSGRGAHVATYQISRADGLLIAAAPELLDMLDTACHALDAAERASSSHSTADNIRRRTAELGLWALHDDNDHEDPESLDPEVDASPSQRTP